MNKCEFCKKIMTNDPEAKPVYLYTLTVDAIGAPTDDKVCGTCEAHNRAIVCARGITADMIKFREIAKKDKIDRPVDYLSSKLDKIKEYWIKYFTKMVEMPKYSNWKYQLTKRVDELTEGLCNIEPEKRKKDKVAY